MGGGEWQQDVLRICGKSVIGRVLGLLVEMILNASAKLFSVFGLFGGKVASIERFSTFICYPLELKILRMFHCSEMRISN